MSYLVKRAYRYGNNVEDYLRDNYGGVAVEWTNFEYDKIAEIKARPNREHNGTYGCFTWPAILFDARYAKKKAAIRKMLDAGVSVGQLVRDGFSYSSVAWVKWEKEECQ
jgi:hypothetical protein